MASLLSAFTPSSPEGDVESHPLTTAVNMHMVADSNSSGDEWKLANIPKALAGIGVSAVSGFYNTGVSVNNFFGGDAEAMDVATTLSTNLDDDYANYYRANKAAIDVAGFVVGSLVPAVGGAKLLNAGQAMLKTAQGAGKFGKGMEMFTKLVAPNVSGAVAEARTALAATNAGYTLKSAQAIKAAAMGFQQAGLEALAGEAMVLATTAQSPVTKDMSAGDLVKQVALGSLIGGGIGGVFNLAAQRSGINKFLTIADKELGPVRSLPSGAGLDESNKILMYQSVREQKEAMIKYSTVDHVPSDVKAASYAAVDDKLNTLIRQSWGEITDNQHTADVMHLLTKDMKFSGLSENMLDSVHWTSSVGGNSITKAENKLAKLEAANAKNLNRAPSDELIAARLETANSGTRSFNTRTGEWTHAADNFGLLRNGTPELIDQAVGKVKVKPMEVQDLDKLSENEVDALYRAIARTDPDKFQKVAAENIPVLEHLASIGKGTEVVMGKESFPMSANDIMETLVKPAKEAKAAAWFNGELIDVNANWSNYAARHNLDERIGMDIQTPSMLSRQENLLADAANFKQRGLDLDPATTPKYITVGHKVTTEMKPTELEAMNYFMNTQQIYQDAMHLATSSNLGAAAARFEPITDDMLASGNRFGAGSGLLSNANGDYGSLASITEYLGKQTEQLLRESRGAIEESLTPVLSKLFGNKEAYLELSVIDKRIADSSEQYVRLGADDAAELAIMIGADASEYGALVPRSYKALLTGETDKLPSIQAKAADFIAIQNTETEDVISVVMKNNSKRRNGYANIAAVEGKNIGSTDSYYPMLRPNPNDQKHFHFIVNKDLSAGDAGRTTMLYARTAEELDTLAKKVDPARFQVVTNKGSADWHKAKGDYSRDEAMTDMFMDVAMKRSGHSSSFHPVTDPDVIVQRIMDQQKAMESTYVRENIKSHYSVEFDKLGKLGNEWDIANASTAGTSTDKSLAKLSNPFNDYKKTILGQSRMGEHPILDPINRGADRLVSEFYGKMQEYFGKGAKSAADGIEIAKIMEQYGVKLAAHDAMTQMLADRQVPAGALTAFVRKAHGFMANTILRLDMLNSVNNAIGTQVLLSAETSNALRKASALALPGTEMEMGSTAKLVAQAHQDYLEHAMSSAKKPTELFKYFKERGYIPSVLDQQAAELETLAQVFKPTSENATLGSRISAATDMMQAKAVRFTLNEQSEAYTRFVSAAAGKRLGEAQGMSGMLLDSYINTFVNRVNGNVTASQRPLIFSGPVGSAVGLFQSYQFNMLQQLFRYAGDEGGKKSVAIAMGMQGSMYGMNGLPGFQLMNKTLLGEQDAYKTTHELAGKQVGNFLLYGIPSTASGISMYSRGDLNPRYATILPNSLADVPVINAGMKTIGNIFDAGSKLAGGADVRKTIIQGIEHNGLSRPLGNMAAMMQGYETSAKGNIRTPIHDDMLSIATLGRLAGGKTMDSSVANDAVFRIQSRDMEQSKKLADLREVVKTHYVGTGSINKTDYTEVLKRYMELGGNQRSWNKWMVDNYKQANTPAANEIATDLSNSNAQYMQKLLRP